MVNNGFLREGVPGVVHDAVIVVSQSEGVDFLRGEFVKVVLLSHHHILSLYFNPVVPRETRFYNILILWNLQKMNGILY